MNVVLQKVGEINVVDFEGRLDSQTAPRIESSLIGFIDSGAHSLIFDLTKLEYISSAGLRVMLLVAKRLRPLGGKLALCGLHPSVHEVFDISGFLSILTVTATQQDALDALQ